MKLNRFDVSTKELVWEDPEGWEERFTIGPIGPVTVIDSDITTLSAGADKVLKVGGPDPYLLNLEPHAYHDLTLTRTLWYRQVALDYRHNLPVLTVLVLLCKEANSPSLTGSYERQLPDGWLTNRYNFRVVRLWEEDPEAYLNAGIGLVPLAPLTKVTEADLPGVVRRMADRINSEPRPRAAKLWTATYLADGTALSGRAVEPTPGRNSYHARIDDLPSHPAGRPAGGRHRRPHRRRTTTLASSGNEAIRAA